MKNKKIMGILFILLVISLGACEKEVIPVNETNDKVVDLSQSEDKSVTSTPTREVDDSAANEITPTPVEAEADIQSQTIIMDTPTFSYFVSDKVVKEESVAKKIDLISSKPNEIIDDDKWFSDNDLALNTFAVPNSFQNIAGNLPDGIEDKWNDLMITKAFYDDSYIYCTYGGDFTQGYILNIYDANTLDIIYSLDFSSYRYTAEYKTEDYDFIEQKITWAAIKDNILYVSNSHNTYAESSNYMNAFITAIDLSDMSILWRTDALVSNANNFWIVDNVIFCGYGFTDEDDYLYQIDINTGKVLDKTLLKTAASYIIKKDNILYVRTYNTNYEFEIN